MLREKVLNISLCLRFVSFLLFQAVDFFLFTVCCFTSLFPVLSLIKFLKHYFCYQARRFQLRNKTHIKYEGLNLKTCPHGCVPCTRSPWRSGTSRVSFPFPQYLSESPIFTPWSGFPSLQAHSLDFLSRPVPAFLFQQGLACPSQQGAFQKKSRNANSLSQRGPPQAFQSQRAQVSPSQLVRFHLCPPAPASPAFPLKTLLTSANFPRALATLTRTHTPRARPPAFRSLRGRASLSPRDLGFRFHRLRMALSRSVSSQRGLGRSRLSRRGPGCRTRRRFRQGRALDAITTITRSRRATRWVTRQD